MIHPQEAYYMYIIYIVHGCIIRNDIHKIIKVSLYDLCTCIIAMTDTALYNHHGLLISLVNKTACYMLHECTCMETWYRYVSVSAVSPMFQKVTGISGHKTWALPEMDRAIILFPHAAQIQIFYNTICIGHVL